MNICKGQYVGLRGIRSEECDYFFNDKIMARQFYLECGFNEKELQKTMRQVVEVYKNDLLMEKIRNNKNTFINICYTWHPKEKIVPIMLRNLFHVIETDPRLLQRTTDFY